MRKEDIIWKFQLKSGHFGFIIPEDRAYWGWDFYVDKKYFNGAEDEQKVRAREIPGGRWKKPEAKILEVLTRKPINKKAEVLKQVEGIYSGGDGNFWFIDVPGQEKWFFVYGKKKNGACDGDKVKADIIMFKWKQEAIVTDILSSDDEIQEWIFKDNDRFGFVLWENGSPDIFIAWSRKWGAQDGDRVSVKIIKQWAKNPEGLILDVF